MVSSFTPELLRLLGQAGCYLVRPGKGDHSIWYSPITKLHFTAGLDHLVERCLWGRREVGVEIDALPIGRCGLPVFEVWREGD